MLDIASSVEALYTWGMDGHKESLMLARALLSRGRFEQAEAYCAKALAAEPDNAEVQLTMANVMLQLGYASEAADLLEKLGSRDLPDDREQIRRLLLDVLDGRGFNDRVSVSASVPNSPTGRMNMRFQSIFPSHRSGWERVLESLHQFHNEDGVLFDGFLEHNFDSPWFNSAPRSPEVLERLRMAGLFKRLASTEERGIIPFREPWIGFLHNPPYPPKWYAQKAVPARLMGSPAWRESQAACLGLFCLSEYHAEWLRERVDVPVNVLLHPTEIPDRQFDPDRFAENGQKKVIQIGSWLRRQNAIYELPLAANNSAGYQKVHLIPNMYDGFAEQADRILATERDGLGVPPAPSEFAENTIRYSHLPNDEYDDLLSENVVFLNLFDASANNAVIECIARATPLLINPHPAVVEYLGEEYPFYYETFEEAARKACDASLVDHAHEYLKVCDTRRKLSFDYFAASFESTEIYESLPR